MAMTFNSFTVTSVSSDSSNREETIIVPLRDPLLQLMSFPGGLTIPFLISWVTSLSGCLWSVWIWDVRGRLMEEGKNYDNKLNRRNL